MWSFVTFLALSGLAQLGTHAEGNLVTSLPDKNSYIDALVANMTVEDLVLQLHLTFGDDIVGVESKNELYGARPSRRGDFPRSSMIRVYDAI
ncbi:hypothetical protein Hte_003223 [Hypoxylon texense]